MEELKEALKMNVFKNERVVEGSVAEEELEAIRDLRDKKYATWEWNYGYSPAFSLIKERKFPAGKIGVCILAEKGRASKFDFKGDFFAGYDISLLEKTLIGAPIGEGLMDWLAARDAGNVAGGIPAEALHDLILY